MKEKGGKDEHENKAKGKEDEKKAYLTSARTALIEGGVCRGCLRSTSN
jgi:hypothetical protein